MSGQARKDTVDVLGIDFTSTPSRRKPLVVAHCQLTGAALRLTRLEPLYTFAEFEHLLQRPGPWIAAMDFPFGQARRFVEGVGWPAAWADYVATTARLDRPGFRQLLEHYKAARPAGDKEHRRATDVKAGSISPQKLYGVPVALMFFEGAPRLLAANVTVPGLHSGDAQRIVVEGYPGIAARCLIGRRSYKSDDRARQGAAQLLARCDILSALIEQAPTRYGFTVEAPESICDDPGADRLDALLCAVQAAWAWRQRHQNFGAPADLDALEGWIADPCIGEPAAVLIDRKACA